MNEYFAPGKTRQFQTVNMSQSELLGATERRGIFIYFFVQCCVCESVRAARDLFNHEVRLQLPAGRLLVCGIIVGRFRFPI